MPTDLSVSLPCRGPLLQVHTPEDGVFPKALLDAQHSLQLRLLPGQLLAAVFRLWGVKKSQLRLGFLPRFFPAVEVRSQGQAAL